MCGEHLACFHQVLGGEGSSPHVRGAHFPYLRDEFTGGIIPACAGSTKRKRVRRAINRDHPRMCGEHFFTSVFRAKSMGSSPHVRGAPDFVVSGATWGGIIPACAGSTTQSTQSTGSTRDHPRMCGEHPKSGIQVPNLLGIIPACAGSTRRCRPRRGRKRDHPRMCGEHSTVPTT